MHYLYILRSLKDDSFYIGSSKDPEKRLAQHNLGLQRYTSKHKPYKLVYTKIFKDKREALLEERRMKSMKSRAYIEKLL